MLDLPDRLIAWLHCCRCVNRAKGLLKNDILIDRDGLAGVLAYRLPVETGCLLTIQQ
jgi:hypothetical protein